MGMLLKKTHKTQFLPRNPTKGSFCKLFHCVFFTSLGGDSFCFAIRGWLCLGSALLSACCGGRSVGFSPLLTQRGEFDGPQGDAGSEIQTSCFQPTHLCTQLSVTPFSHTGADKKMSYFVDSAVSGPAPYSAVRPAVMVSGPLPGPPRTSPTFPLTLLPASWPVLD